MTGALAGLLILAVSLAGLMIVTSALGASNPKEALALPNGSIRALLALSLVVVFVVVASWTLRPENQQKASVVMVTGPYPAEQLRARLEEMRTSFPGPRFMVIPVTEEESLVKPGASSPAAPANPPNPTPGAATTADSSKKSGPPPAPKLTPAVDSATSRIEVIDVQAGQQLADTQKQNLDSYRHSFCDGGRVLLQVESRGARRCQGGKRGC